MVLSIDSAELKVRGKILQLTPHICGSHICIFNQSSMENILKKISESSKKPNLNLPHEGNCLHCIRYYKQSRYDLKYRGEGVEVICKYDAILYKGLEHPWLLVSQGVLEPIPFRYLRTADLWVIEEFFPLTFDIFRS